MTHRGQDSSTFRIQGAECYKPCSCRRPTATPSATPFLLLHYPPFDPLLLRPSLHRLPPLLQRLSFPLLLSPPPPLRCRRPSVRPLRAVSPFPHVRNRRRGTGWREARGLSDAAASGFLACLRVGGRSRDFQQPARHGKEARPAKEAGEEALEGHVSEAEWRAWGSALGSRLRLRRDPGVPGWSSSLAREDGAAAVG